MTAGARHEVSVRVNGSAQTVAVEARRTLADVLRDDLGLHGTHLGCEHGICGACTVLVDGEPTRACLVFAVQVDGRAVDTVEGLAAGEEGSSLQQAFSAAHALQCGFCTPGFLMVATALLRDEPRPSRERIREAVSANLCRCTGYTPIVDAVAAAAGGRGEPGTAAGADRSQ